MLFYEQLDKEDPCKTCDMRYKCGGECLLEKRLYNGVNPAMCMYKKHLIYLAD
jgi:radical SAM protein with 4Fe4S-binding SPASM domain